MKLAKSILVLAFAISLAACGSDDSQALVDAGYAALRSGRSDEALDKFSQAVRAIEPADARYVDARMGVAESLIANRPAEAVDEFLRLSAELPGRIGEKDFLYMGGQLIHGDKFHDAIRLLKTGIDRAGGKSPALEERMVRMNKEAAHDQSVIDALKGLGY